MKTSKISPNNPFICKCGKILYSDDDYDDHIWNDECSFSIINKFFNLAKNDPFDIEIYPNKEGKRKINISERKYYQTLRKYKFSIEEPAFLNFTLIYKQN